MSDDPISFVQAAYADVRELTNEGNQRHRSAAAGKPLCVHIHGWNRWSNAVPAPAGMREYIGGKSVTLRLQGQYIDRGNRHTSLTTMDAEKFAIEVQRLLSEMLPPIPGID